MPHDVWPTLKGRRVPAAFQGTSLRIYLLQGDALSYRNPAPSAPRYLLRSAVQISTAKLLIKQNRNSIIGKTYLRVARAGAHNREMVFTGLDSLFEQVGQGLQVGGGVMQYKRRGVRSCVPVIQKAGA